MNLSRILFLTIITFITFLQDSIGQTSISNLMRKYKNDSKVAAIKYEGESFKKYLADDAGIKTSLDYVDIMTFSNKHDMSIKDKAKIKVLLANDNFEELINAKYPDGTMKIYALSSKENISSLYASFKMNNTVYYVLMKGNIYLNELATISGKLNLKQLDFMKNIK